jgi:hypothetical protein
VPHAAPATQRSNSSAKRPPRARSPAGVPDSTMRPSETTAIWSAWAMVDSRWAMMMVVRPERSRWRASVMRASEVASRLLVASSRISRAGSAIQARAKATSCRSPAASSAPPLVDLGVVAVGQAGDDLVGPDGPGGRLDLGPGRVRAAEADVVGYRGLTTAKAGEQEPILWELVPLRVRNAPPSASKSAQIPLTSLMPLSALSARTRATVRCVRFAGTIGVVSLAIARGRSKVVTHGVAGGYLHHLMGYDWRRRNRRLIAVEVSTMRWTAQRVTMLPGAAWRQSPEQRSCDRGRRDGVGGGRCQPHRGGTDCRPIAQSRRERSGVGR